MLVVNSILVIPGDNGLLDNIVSKHNLGRILNTSKEIEDFIINPHVDYNPNSKDLDFFSRRNQTEIMSKIIKEQILKYDES